MSENDNEKYELLYKICERADVLNVAATGRVNLLLSLSMVAQKYDVDLNALLNFPDYDFVHDVTGILRHLNRTTGRLEDCFVPRCTR